jgi:hypothetical protein
LRTTFTELFDEPHLGSDHHLTEAAVKDAVLVKVNLVSFGRFEKAVPFVDEELAHPTVSLGLMRLRVASLPSHVILKHASRVVERVIDRGVHVSVAGPYVRSPADDELVSRNRQVDEDPVVPSVPMVLMRCLQGDVATDDSVEERPELRGSLTDVILDSGGTLDTAKGDLNGILHGEPRFRRMSFEADRVP